MKLRNEEFRWAEVKWAYLVWVLDGPIGWVIYLVHSQLLGQLIAIGDTAHPVVPAGLAATLDVLNFPMFYLWFPVGEWLKPYLTDSGVCDLFVSINALFWGYAVRRIIRLVGPWN